MGVTAAHSGLDLRPASYLARTASASRPSGFHWFWHVAMLAAILWLALRTRHLTHVIITIRSSSSNNSSDYLSAPPGEDHVQTSVRLPLAVHRPPLSVVLLFHPASSALTPMPRPAST